MISLMGGPLARRFVVAAEKTAQDSGHLLEALAELRSGWLKEYEGQEITLVHPNGDHVNGAYFKGDHKSAILFLHGNGCFYETTLDRPWQWIEALKQGGHTPHLLVFNPRGTGKSQGVTHPQTVAEDLLAAFRYLVEQGVDPSRVVVAGHSMGAFFGAFGAALIQETFPEHSIHFLSDRSFRAMKDRVDAQVTYSEGGRIRKKIERFVGHALVTLSGWNRDPLEALRSLKGKVCLLYHREDDVIPYATSLHASLKDPSAFVCCQLGVQEKSGSSAHNRFYTAEEWDRIEGEIKSMLGF